MSVSAPSPEQLFNRLPESERQRRVHQFIEALERETMEQFRPDHDLMLLHDVLKSEVLLKGDRAVLNV